MNIVYSIFLIYTGNTTSGEDMKKIMLTLLVVFLLTGCMIGNTPTSLVENLFNKYQMLDDDIKNEIDTMLSEQNLTDEQINRYKKLLENQYKNLSYTIKEEMIDGDRAIVTVEIEVIDYKKAIGDFNFDSNLYTKYEYDNKKLDLLEEADEKVIYTIDFSVSKDSDGNWHLDSLSNATLKKIEGMY